MPKILHLNTDAKTSTEIHVEMLQMLEKEHEAKPVKGPWRKIALKLIEAVSVRDQMLASIGYNSKRRTAAIDVMMKTLKKRDREILKERAGKEKEKLREL